jgi:hypothetical protein
MGYFKRVEVVLSLDALKTRVQLRKLCSPTAGGVGKADCMKIDSV